MRRVKRLTNVPTPAGKASVTKKCCQPDNSIPYYRDPSRRLSVDPPLNHTILLDRDPSRWHSVDPSPSHKC